MHDLIVIAHNIRSAHNIGAIFRNCEGFGVKRLIISGYSPYPTLPEDPRLPHISTKITHQIHKTALGAENMVTFDYQPAPDLARLRDEGYEIIGLEQDEGSISLPSFRPTKHTALLLGEEVHGIEPLLLEQCDRLVEIPMDGDKESFNVSVATGIALYHLRHVPTIGA